MYIIIRLSQALLPNQIIGSIVVQKIMQTKLGLLKLIFYEISKLKRQEQYGTSCKLAPAEVLKLKILSCSEKILFDKYKKLIVREIRKTITESWV